MLVGEARGAVGVEEVAEREPGGRLSWRDRVEGQARPPIEQLTCGAEARRTRRDRTGGGRDRQRLGRDGREQRVDGRELGLPIDGRRGRVAVSARRVPVGYAADQVCGRIHLIAMAEVERHERLLHRRQGPPLADDGIGKPVQGDPADGHLVAKRLHGVGTVVPEGAGRRGRAGGPRVGIGDVAEAAVAVLRQHPVRLGVVADVAVAHRLDVPLAHADRVRVRHVDLAIGQRRQRGRVVHH